MKIIHLLTILCMSYMNSHGQFDQQLADSLGADEYGMKSYVMAFLKKGPNRDRTKEEAAVLQKAHLDNIKVLAENGKMVLAGPFFGNSNDELRGIYIFNVATIEEVELLTATDPAIKAGSLIMDLKQWYGSAALMHVNYLHDKTAKKSF